MANAPPKKSVISRLTAKLMKSGSERRTQLPDYPQEKCPELPEKLEMDVMVKWSGKMKPRNRTKKQRAILAAGKLELRDRNKPDTVGLACGYTLDLAKSQVLCEERRLIVCFPTETTASLAPGDAAATERLRQAVNKHRLYRQEQLHREQPASTAAAAAAQPPVSLVSTTDDFKAWDFDPTATKVFEAVRDMQSLSLAVLEKSTKCLEELKISAEELRNICGAQPAPPTPLLPPPPKTPEWVQPVQPISQSFSGKEGEDDVDEEDDDEEELDAETEKELLTPVAVKTPILRSLESAREGAFEKSKRDVLARCEKILDKMPSAPRSKTAPPLPAAPIVAVKKVGKKEPEKNLQLPSREVKKSRRARRELLPKPQLPSESIGFKAMYQMLVNKTGMPLTGYEPIGIVQATCEELLWSNMLEIAASRPLAEDRMSLVTAFAMTSYLTKAGRYRKPFNPILGETFDFEEPGWKFHGEQVSHHPAITAGFAEGHNWCFYITFHLETVVGKLSRCLELTMDEPLRVRLKLPDGTTEDYIWHKIKTKIENLTSAPEQRKITHEGTLSVRSTTGYTGRIFFKKHRNPQEVTGDVVTPNDRLCYRLAGCWDKNLVRIRTTGERELLVNGDNLRRYPDYYGFNSFTMGLNEADSGLPTSDSRHRMDMRALEHGNLAAAAKHKRLLEEQQRARARTHHKPLWFESVRDEATKKLVYFPNNKYWEAKASGFADVKDMIDLHTTEN